jgi:hypothetical protein
MDLAEIADIIEAEALDASLSASQVEKVGVLIRLSDDAAANELAFWQRRAGQWREAARTIRMLIGTSKLHAIDITSAFAETGIPCRVCVAPGYRGPTQPPVSSK